MRTIKESLLPILVPQVETRDGFFHIHQSGIQQCWTTMDNCLDVVEFRNGNLVAGIPTHTRMTPYYPLKSSELKYPLLAVLMDLDGTSVLSEDFWVSVIRDTVRTATKNYGFSFQPEDYPHLVGHSVASHLSYCKSKYNIDFGLGSLERIYYNIVAQLNQLEQLENVTIAPYLSELIETFKKHSVSVGLVTSGIYLKAYPEVKSLIAQLGYQSPEQVYNAIITAGVSPYYSTFQTLGDLSAKPHPWLYLECANKGLGLISGHFSHAVVIEDSSAGVWAAVLAGLPVIGLTTGNIRENGLDKLCITMCNDLQEVNKFLSDKELFE